MPTAPLNILQTCFSPSWGGLEIQALELSRRLLRRGHRVLLSCLPSTPLAREAERSGVPLLLHNVRGYVHPFVIARLASELRRNEIEMIHCQHSRDIATVVPATLLSGGRRHVLLSKRVGSAITKKDFFHRLTHRHISRVLAISEAIHANVLATLPVDPERIVTLHDAVDTDEFSPRPGDRPAIKSSFGFSKDSLLVGFVGRFSPGKGHEELLQAAASLKPDFPEVRYLVVGEASFGEEAYAGRIRQLALTLGVADVVKFAGFRKDIPQVMQAFDLFAFPSHAESFGVVLIEAMAVGLPAVSTNCDGVLDIMVEGETGLMVPPKNANELARALRILLEDSAVRAQMGFAARRRVVELFDQQKQIERLEQIYADVLSSPPT
jgi:glycosyltransferase involved in cell wall biosynthesis